MTFKSILGLSSIFLCFFLIACSGGNSRNGCVLASYTRTPNSAMPISKSQYVGVGSSLQFGPSAAQSFQVLPGPSPSPSSLSIPVSATVQLSLVGSFSTGTQTLVATIEGDAGGSPNNTRLFTSSNVDPSTLSSTATAVTFNFPSGSGTSLAPNTTYWLRIIGSFPLSSSHYVTWSGSNDQNYPYQLGGANFSAKSETTTSTFTTSYMGVMFLYFLLGC